MMELTCEQKSFLDRVVNGSWNINYMTLRIDVDGSVSVPYRYINNGKIPVSFGKVTGNFSMSSNQLVTLEGCPCWVGGNFNCIDNNITNLKYAPIHIRKDAHVWNNRMIQSLNWEPEHIGGKLFIKIETISEKYLDTIIPEIEMLMEKGVNLNSPDESYYPIRDAYYETKVAELL